ncbi:hypothetical protein TESG_01608 [Trichophyton tonsurans CBS 112818]|uniref:Acetylxylan esterase n=1 Tax=Trichophyton tonsurans (strain CBS 112818) TaxID=647933 RepID=F2RRA2_TRIT1|nr:hypothetical protein TESG_01608 [Trichophyton tonsurans CBS 112818]
MKWNLAISLIVCLAASVCSAGRDDFFHIPDRVKCKEVLVIIGRGTSEPPGEGPQRIFGKELQRRLGEDRVDHIPLDWPASLFPTYGESVRLVVAVLEWEIPPTIPANPYNAGTATRKGWFPRRNDESCRKYDHVRVSYCDHGDIYCDHGLDPLVHSSYFKNYFEHCMRFMIRKIEGIDP